MDRVAVLLDSLAGQVNLDLFDMDDCAMYEWHGFHEGRADGEHGPIGRKLLRCAPYKVLRNLLVRFHELATFKIQHLIL